MPRKNHDSHWFKFYPDKYLGGTGGFTFEMHGAYLIMLLHQWSNGPFQEETATAMIGDIWKKISYKFKKTDAGFANERIELESEYRREISKKRSESVQERYKCTTNVLQDEYTCSTNEVQRMSVSVSSYSSELFEMFWSLYPRKEGKGIAEKSFKKIKEPIKTFELIESALLWQKESEQWKKDGGQYIPMPATYINQKRWLDEKKDIQLKPKWHMQ